MTAHEKETLEYVKKHKELEPYFFSKLIKKKDSKWLNILKKRGFFDKINIPRDNKNGYIEEWNVLNYVKSIIGTLIVEKKECEIKYILEVLLQVAEIHNNYRVIMQSINILKDLPTNLYEKKQLSYLIKKWFDCDYGLDLILYDISKDLLPSIAKSNTDKKLRLFKDIFNKICKYKNKRNHILNNIISNDILIQDLTDTHYFKIVNYLIDLLEKVIAVKSSERRLGDKIFKFIKTNDNCYTLYINEEEICDNDFKNKIRSINNIVCKIKNKYPNVKKRELDRIIKHMVSDLYSKQAYESIFTDKDYLFEFHDYLIALLKKCILFNIKKYNPTIQILKKCINSNYDLTFKLLLFIVCSNFTKYKDFIFDNIDNEVINYIIRHYIFEDELKHFFENLSFLDSHHIKKIENIIEQGEYIEHDWEDDKYFAKWKQKRFYALNNIKYFQKKYQSLREFTGKDVELIAPISSTSADWIEQKSPITKEQIVKMSNEELIKILKSFKEDKTTNFGFTEISYRGLGNTLKEVIQLFPERFVNNLNEFNSLHYEITISILEAFKEIISTDNNVDFQKIVQFIYLYTSKEDFWLDNYCYASDKNHLILHQSFLKSSLRLISDYLSNDKLNFTEVIYNIIMQVLNLFYSKCTFNNIEEDLYNNNDYNFYSLNSLAGIFSKVLLDLALKIKRVNLKNNKSYWERKIKKIYTQLLVEKCIDTYFILGKYIGQFSYIEKKWVKKEILSITTENTMWEFFMSGLLCSQTVYGEYFVLLKDYYLCALDYNFKDKDIKKHLIEHITFAYLNRFEEKTNTQIFNKVIEKWNIFSMQQIVKLCQNIKEKSFAKGICLKDVKEKVLIIWTMIIDRYKKRKFDDISQEELKLIRDSMRLINNFDSINNLISENIMFSFKFIKDGFIYYDLIQYFIDLINSIKIDSDTELLQKIIYEFMVKCLPSFPQDKIIKLILYLKNNKKNKFLEEIAEAYLKNCKDTSFVPKYIFEEI